mmetsp:Transcript_28788/g.35028  ORF Transcript_28788/g.35028 Transcript_28788/m.35028 type:complete len:85 (-) Transcript_28788:9-263(-)
MGARPRSSLYLYVVTLSQQFSDDMKRASDEDVEVTGGRKCLERLSLSSTTGYTSQTTIPQHAEVHFVMKVSRRGIAQTLHERRV